MCRLSFETTDSVDGFEIQTQEDGSGTLNPVNLHEALDHCVTAATISSLVGAGDGRNIKSERPSGWLGNRGFNLKIHQLLVDIKKCQILTAIEIYDFCHVYQLNLSPFSLTFTTISHNYMKYHLKIIMPVLVP